VSISRKSGQTTVWLSIMLVVTGLLSSLAYFLGTAAKGTGRKIVANRSSLRTATLAETALVAYRLAEVKYLAFASTCSAARPFLEALGTGSGCAGAFTAFDPNDAADFGVRDGLYRFSGPGCRITQLSSTCGAGRTEVLSGDLDTLTTGAAGAQATGFRVALVSVQAAKGRAEFSGEVTEGGRTQKIGFAIRAPLATSAHLEQDGRVTQNTPDPLAICPGTVWADLLLFNPANRRCERYEQAGGGTGLALYADHYFGLRPADGQIVDLTAMTQGNGYLVSPATGAPNFVPYNQTLLINVDDITLIDRQIYYLANFGSQPQLGYLDMSGSGIRVSLCDLTSMGWMQSYEGIAAHSSSDPLFPDPNDGMPASAVRIATMFLKTSSGDLLTALIESWPAGGAPAGPSVSYAGRTLTCQVYKDQNLQEIEFSRTNGFDRIPGVKPYIVF